LLTNVKPSIFIIDDNTSILRTFSKIFQRHGYKVDIAATGSEAIQKIFKNFFDVALIDFCLPDMEGTQLFPLIEMSSYKTLKIILIAESLTSVDGVDMLIGKSVEPMKLLRLSTPN
jgi:DNA-binding NtrC family response regulator